MKRLLFLAALVAVILVVVLAPSPIHAAGVAHDVVSAAQSVPVPVIPTDLASFYVWIGGASMIVIQLLSTWPKFANASPLTHKLAALGIALVLGVISYILVQNEPADLPAGLTALFAVIATIVDSFFSSQTAMTLGRWVGRKQARAEVYHQVKMHEMSEQLVKG